MKRIIVFLVSLLFSVSSFATYDYMMKAKSEKSTIFTCSNISDLLAKGEAHEVPDSGYEGGVRIDFDNPNNVFQMVIKGNDIDHPFIELSNYLTDERMVATNYFDYIDIDSNWIAMFSSEDPELTVTLEKHEIEDNWFEADVDVPNGYTAKMYCFTAREKPFQEYTPEW